MKVNRITPKYLPGVDPQGDASGQFTRPLKPVAIDDILFLSATEMRCGINVAPDGERIVVLMLNDAAYGIMQGYTPEGARRLALQLTNMAYMIEAGCALGEGGVA